jgi:hypothetical protein
VLLIASTWLPARGEVIRRIDIVRKPVYEENELPLGATRLFNALHVLTCEDVIRRDVVAEEGGPSDSLLIAESARILRNRGYLGDVTVDTVRVPGDSIDLVFTTRDLWTLDISIQPRGGGGEYSLDFAASESNFRGRAQHLEVGYNISDRRSSGRVLFGEPALFRPHLESGLSYGSHDNGNSFGAFVIHPLWAVTERWQYGASISRVRDDQLFYKAEQEAFAYPYTYRSTRAEVSRAWGRLTRIRAGAAVSWTEHALGRLYSYAGVPSALLAESTLYSAPDRKRVIPSFELAVEHFHYPTARFMDRFGRTEDFTTGIGVSAAAGKVSADLGSSVSRVVWLGQFQAGAVHGPVYSNMQASLLHEADDGTNTGRTEFYSEAHLYVKTALRQVLAVRAVRSGWYRANRQGQMLLGGLNGVRGLPARFDDGTRIWHLNAEYRYFSPVRILTADIGGAVFTDMGQVWDRGEAVRLHDAEWAVGAGLRIGLSRSAGDQVLRLDLAHGGNGWVATFGTQMYFTFNLKGSLRL